MAEIIIMPKLGFNMNEGKLVEWYKNEGDSIAKGEPLFSVETDKTNMDIEATGDGVVKALLINAGDAVPVTLPIAIIGTADEDVAALVADARAQLAGEGVASAEAHVPNEASPAVPSETTVQVATEVMPKTAGGSLKITPRARRVAAEKGVSLENINITGTGWDGGVCEKDVLEHLEFNRIKVTPVAKNMAKVGQIDLEAVVGTGFLGKITKADVAAVGNKEEITKPDSECSEAKFTPCGKEILEEVPYAGVRKVIGERLSESKFTAPHVYFMQKINLEELLKLRKQINEAQDKKTSVTDYIAKAVIIALQKYPEMNSSLVGNIIKKYKSINLGIAVASPTGLIVPTIKEAQTMSVIDISKKSTALINKAREGNLTPDEYSAGTFTISNLGMFGIDMFTAIINPPEVGILAVSATKDEPVVVVNDDGTKEIAIKPMMSIQLTVDHRVIDGLLAAQFVAELKNLLENPISLLI